MKLYYSPGACSLAPHIVLEELGDAYQLELISIDEGKTRTPEFLAINSKGRVPVTEQGEVLTEVSAICWYLARQCDHTVMSPHDPLAGARVLEWCSWLSGAVHAISFAQIWRPHRFVTDEALYPPIQAKGTRRRAGPFRHHRSPHSQARLGSGQRLHLCGCLSHCFFRWGNRIGLDMRTDYPDWTRHAERVAERPAVQRALQQEGIGIWDKAI